jgi:hypothetical protein
MKKSRVESSRKVWRSGNIMCARLTPSRMIIGVLSITVLLCSLSSACAEITSIHALAAPASTGVNSVTKRILVPIDTSTLVNAIVIPIKHTPTRHGKPTPAPLPITPAPIPTRHGGSTPAPMPITSTPTPTAMSTPTPTSTPTNSPSPTHTPTSSPRVTTRTASTLPPGNTTTATTSGLPGTTYTDTAVVATPDSSPQSTLPTDSVVPSTGQVQKNSNFPFMPLIIELVGSVAVLYCVFIGQRYLNNRKLAQTWNSPSSGAYTWSGELTNTTSWDISQNGNSTYNGYNDWVSDSSVPSGYDGATATMSQASNGMDSPTPVFEAYADSGSFAPPNWSYSPLNNDPASVPPATPHPDLCGPQAIGMDNTSHETNADEQWLDDHSESDVDFNDPYLQGILKEYSEKSKDAWQQRDVDGKG